MVLRTATTMIEPPAESGTCGREQHPNLTSSSEINKLKKKLMVNVHETMRIGAALGLSTFLLFATGQDGEQRIHCNDLSMRQAMSAVVDSVGGSEKKINPVLEKMHQSMRGENDKYLLGKVDKPKLTAVHETLNSMYKAPSEKKPSTGRAVTATVLEDGIAEWHDRGYDKFTPGMRNYLNRQGKKLVEFGSKAINDTNMPRPFPQGSELPLPEPQWFKTHIVGKKRPRSKQVRSPSGKIRSNEKATASEES